MKPTRHSFVEVYVHLVWSTKDRIPILDEPRFSKMRDISFDSAKKNDFEVRAFGGVEDHLHLLLRYRPDQRISDIVRLLKAPMSYWLRREGGLPDFEWQEGYGAFSISAQDTTRIIRYIECQREHHKMGTIEEGMESA